MSTPTVAADRAPGSTARRANALRDGWVVTKNNLRKMPRIPEVTLFALIQPVMFVLLFRYVFGGAIPVPGGEDVNYAEYLLPGIFVQTVAFATASASSGIATDMHKGIVDRFRSLPMARSAVLLGRTAADLVQTAFVTVVMMVCGLAVGWRIHEGVARAVLGVVLLLLLAFAFTWIGALIGLSVRTPEAATSGGLIWLFPLTFVSNIFVAPVSMPDWLRVVADWNPLSAVTLALRELFGNPTGLPSDAWPMQNPVLASFLWIAVILLAFVTLSVRKYQSMSR
ncbi:ABC transporter permease [Allostreptomyces psammosilenae]|uniref:Transport permease protein n=1 Tax=Allostreptomyces psammosilenae TaxID=1892865 RepID=A0A852ZXT2_9ACTN|nr:ABC transporter permease [Allostreptomyces psammosilenae]NYI06050.1 ABC transporter DrrB family efflux protein [Allostreptomyces psammosilenae]